jgi:hypothetical protein
LVSLPHALPGFRLLRFTPAQHAHRRLRETVRPGTSSLPSPGSRLLPALPVQSLTVSAARAGTVSIVSISNVLTAQHALDYIRCFLDCTLARNYYLGETPASLSALSA